MTDRDLKKMSRKELLELLIASENENSQLKEQIRQQEQLLKNRDIQVQNAGNMAEAALALNGAFDSADKAAQQYLENVKRYSEQQKSIYDRIVGEAEAKAKEILDRAEAERLQKIESAEAYWQVLNDRLEEFCRAHAGMRELLMVMMRKKTGEDK